MIATSAGLGRYQNIAAALQRLEEKPRGKLLLKPNLVAGGLAASHVDAVRGVLDNLDIKLIAEGSGIDTNELYSMLGYRKLAREYGVDLVDINRTGGWRRAVEFELIDGSKVKVRVSSYAKRYNIVSLALPKTHDHAIVTLTLKNMMGFVHPEDKGLVHGYSATFGRVMSSAVLRRLASRLSRFKQLSRLYSSTEVEQAKYVLGVRVIHKNIATLLRFAAPKLGVIDGFVGMQGDGPVGGETFEWNIAIAGKPPECDVFCTHKMGFDPTEIGYLHYLRAPSVDDIQVIDDEVKGKKFRPHRKFRLQLMWKE
jgi:uncharacterized protein (DUF362 family)